MSFQKKIQEPYYYHIKYEHDTNNSFLIIQKIKYNL